MIELRRRALRCLDFRIPSSVSSEKQHANVVRGEATCGVVSFIRRMISMVVLGGARFPAKEKTMSIRLRVNIREFLTT